LSAPATPTLRGFAKVIRDRTAVKQAEQRLRASKKRLQRMINIDVLGVLIFDASGTLIDANDAFLAMIG
jgi:PAS domain-containing protein